MPGTVFIVSLTVCDIIKKKWRFAYDQQSAAATRNHRTIALTGHLLSTVIKRSFFALQITDSYVHKYIFYLSSIKLNIFDILLTLHLNISILILNNLMH